jgi:hypothetical protein
MVKFWTPKVEEKKGRFAIFAGVSRLSKFFKSKEDAQNELDKNFSFYNYWGGSISVSVDNSPKKILEVSK